MAPIRDSMGSGEAQSACSAYDDIEAGGGGEGFRRDVRAGRARRPYDDLPDMLGGLHTAERQHRLMGLEHPVGQRTQFLAGEQIRERETIISRAMSGLAASSSSRSTPL